MLDRIEPTSRSLFASGLLPSRADPVFNASGQRDRISRNEINSVQADLAARPPVDSARVEWLRTAIASGQYPLDPAAIADAMIAQELAPR